MKTNKFIGTSGTSPPSTKSLNQDAEELNEQLQFLPQEEPQKETGEDPLYDKIMMQINAYERSMTYIQKFEKALLSSNEVTPEELALYQKAKRFVFSCSDTPESGKETKITQIHKPKSKRPMLVASMLVLCLSCGTLAIGSSEYLGELVQEKIGSATALYSTTVENPYVELENCTYEHALEMAKDCIDSDFLQLPESLDLNFSRIIADNTIQKTTFFYLYEDRIIEYSITKNSTNTFQTTDELSKSPEYYFDYIVPVTVETFTDYKRVSFTYDSLYYMITGYLSDEDILNLLNTTL